MFTITVETAVQLDVTPGASLMQLFFFLQAFLQRKTPCVALWIISDVGSLDEEDREFG